MKLKDEDREAIGATVLYGPWARNVYDTVDLVVRMLTEFGYFAQPAVDAEALARAYWRECHDPDGFISPQQLGAFSRALAKVGVLDARELREAVATAERERDEAIARAEKAEAERDGERGLRKTWEDVAQTRLDELLDRNAELARLRAPLTEERRRAPWPWEYWIVGLGQAESAPAEPAEAWPSDEAVSNAYHVFCTTPGTGTAGIRAALLAAGRPPAEPVRVERVTNEMCHVAIVNLPREYRVEDVWIKHMRPALEAALAVAPRGTGEMLEGFGVPLEAGVHLGYFVHNTEDDPPMLACVKQVCEEAIEDAWAGESVRDGDELRLWTVYAKPVETRRARVILEPADPAHAGGEDGER